MTENRRQMTDELSDQAEPRLLIYNLSSDLCLLSSDSCNDKSPGIIPEAFKNKKPRVATRSTRGVNDQILALTGRMDASKAKKEAPEIKVSFCIEIRVHIRISVDN